MYLPHNFVCVPGMWQFVNSNRWSSFDLPVFQVGIPAKNGLLPCDYSKCASSRDDDGFWEIFPPTYATNYETPRVKVYNSFTSFFSSLENASKLEVESTMDFGSD
jgi:hypothetical protein